MMPRWRIVLGLTVVWLLLWGSITPTLVVGGLLTSVLVLMLFPFPQAPWRWTLRPWPTLVLLAVFAADLLRASVQVAWLAVRPAAPPPRAATMLGAKPAMRKPSCVPIAMPEKRTRVLNISP